MASQRSLPEKVEDIKTTYAQFRELLTDAPLRELVDASNAAAAAAAQKGDIAMYAELVQGRIQVQRVIAANDRAALLAAVMTNAGGVRTVPLDDND